MKFNTFKSKIIISLIIVIASVSFIAFFSFNNLLSFKIYKDAERNMASTFDLLKDQYYFTIDSHDGKIIRSMLKKTESNDMIIQTILINSQGRVLFPDSVDAKDSKFDVKRLDKFPENIKIETIQDNDSLFSRAYMRLNNDKLCLKCHSSVNKNLGYIISDFYIGVERSNISYINWFSLIFTIIMIGVIVALVIIMHYKFVKKYLSDFQSSINIVNNGDLNQRIIIPETKEFGNLAISFNKMLETFHKTQLELQAIHQQKLKDSKKLATIGEMSARLAHEIRNPIMGIANAAEVIIDDISCSQDKSILEEIKRQADRVNNVVNDLLKYSRSAKLKLAEHNINNIIESLVFFLQNQENKKQIEIITELQANIPNFEFDHDQMESVLLDIIYNAMHAINKKGSIIIKTRSIENHHIEILIKDTGSGISKEVLEDIFNPFFTTRTEGTGLGLAIAKDTIEKHGGGIRAESKEGKGTSIYILLSIDPKKYVI